MNDLFSKQTTALYADVWEKIKRGEPLSGVSVEIAKAMQEHPELAPFWKQGDAAFCPQEVNGFIVNPLVHIGLHVVIEKQLEDGDPIEVGVALKNLLQKGISRHDAIHQIAGLWGDLYFRSVRRGGPLDEGAYLHELIALSETTP